MKIRIEVADDLPDEVVIRCRAVDETVKSIRDAVNAALYRQETLLLTIGEAEYLIPVQDILFFETEDEKVAAHTAKGMYSCDKKLYALLQMLPSTFLRVSKSCILNSAAVCAIRKNITGSSEVQFSGSEKKAYVSRLYYHALRDLIEETRLKK